ncbi:hypothetical protein BG015_000465 [Linnemannia schmuckeri]|uniref:Pentatricopeptide repeat protein n=1 Tax=Linnemannia schmuckeri TaxID=64567 RepID=A0A9P5V7J5_9FUNG|nr:hypothetical protein BG015_000465 [Linnemannia schmuckeri]
MPKPLPAGGRGAPGGLLLLHGRRQHHRRFPSSRRLLLAQEQESLHRTWNAVIQFSARHLFCPAHAHTQVQTVTTTATTAYKPIAAVSRIHGSGSGGGGHLHLSHHTTAATRSINGLLLPGSNLTVSSRGAASFVPRKLSTAAAIESSEDASLYSSGYAHQRSPQDICFQREPITAVPSRSSGSGPATPGRGAAPHSAHKPTSISPRQDEKDELTPSVESSPKQTHIKSSSWRFPIEDSGSKFYNDNNDPNPLEPVQSWASTANALSELYKSLHHLSSSSSSSKSTTTTGRSSSATILHSALANYNYLSRLQSLYDTILVPRRHTRALFLLQGREPKTRNNLEQLLRITTDLIWLNEKERQKKRRTASKLASFAISTSAGSTTNSSATSSYVYNPADDYHGLRVSEYTILMNWIGSLTSTLGAQSSSAAISVANSPSIPSTTTAATTARSMAPTPRYQHPIALSGPVDQAWAIWQDFLLTGMKPDIVLYTMLMDTLLKAREFERADQIWNHMQSQGSSSDGGKGSSRNGSVTAGLEVISSPRSPSSTRSREHSEATSPNTHAVVPNLQTLSVMMQSHIQESDIDGVARTYKQLHQTTLHREQQRPINTVLVNQILKVLVDLGETKAARAIFSEMQVDDCDIGAGSLSFGSYTEENYTNNNGGVATAPASATATRPAVFSTPIHHQTSRRRASWKRDNRKRPSSSTISTSDTSTAAGLSIRPNEATYRLMLQVARREMDSDLEDQVLKELRCLPLPSSSPSSEPLK